MPTHSSSCAAAYAARRGDETSSAPAPHLIVQVPLHGPATVAGVPLPDAMVERLRAQAKVEPVLVDDDGEPIAVGPRRVDAVARRPSGSCANATGSAAGPAATNASASRSTTSGPHPGAAATSSGTSPPSAGTTTTSSHPKARWLLLGNPNNPAGLSLIDRDDLPKLAQLAADRARAGSEAA